MKGNAPEEVVAVASTHFSVALLEVLDEFHQVCWVSDDFKVEFFY